MDKLGVKILVQKLRNSLLLPDLSQILCVVYGTYYVHFMPLYGYFMHFENMHMKICSPTLQSYNKLNP